MITVDGCTILEKLIELLSVGTETNVQVLARRNLIASISTE